MTVSIVLIGADPLLPGESMPELSANPPIEKVRVNRRTHCGVEVFKLLMLICTNDLKFPVERPNLKGELPLSYHSPELLLISLLRILDP